jgi:hypothetical protein
MKVHRGKILKYLGMSLDFSHKEQCHVTMYDYLDGILQAFDAALKKHSNGFVPATKGHFKTVASNNLFTVIKDCEKLSEAAAADFHIIVAKTLYVTKRATPDTCLEIVFLTTRVRALDTDDREKLCHLIEYLRGNCDQPLILGAKNNGLLMWYIDASFAVQPNMRGHRGGGLTLGRGFPISVSTKQKLNIKSSTKSELVGVDDMMSVITWAHYFLLSKGYGIIENFLLQDNKNSILLKQYGALSGKCTRHINI